MRSEGGREGEAGKIPVCISRQQKATRGIKAESNDAELLCVGGDLLGYYSTQNSSRLAC